MAVSECALQTILEDVGQSEIVEGYFHSWDRTRLFYRCWGSRKSSNKALIFIHRGHEHSGRISQQVADFGLADGKGFLAYSWDMRGHGRSPGPRGYADSFYDHVKDLNAFVKHVSLTHDIPIENMAVVANSIGAVAASAWVHDYAPRIRAMVLAAPAFRVRLYLPFAIPALRLLAKIRSRANISSYVKSKMLTHDPEQIRSYDEDQFITRNIAVNVLLGLHDLSTRIVEDAGTITTPTLIVSAGSDWVVRNSAQHKFFKKLSSPMKEMEIYPGFFHSLLSEKDRELPLKKAQDFIEQAFEQTVDRSQLLQADRQGFTREEYIDLSQPPVPSRAIYFGVQKAAMRTLGQLSSGLRLGWKTGHNSGDSLDYIYVNKAHGITPLGKLIDRAYLNAVGWQAMRQRQGILEDQLRSVIHSLIAAGQAVQIIDIAAGRGRYVLDILQEFPTAKIHAVLRDRSTSSLNASAKVAESLGLARVSFETGDAFDKEDLLTVKPIPNVAIVSGLFELFPANAPVVESLEGLAGLMEPGGYLIYTCQPWHPQIEEIARTCVDWNGKPWVMRRRSQAEMDELVRSVGFEKIDMGIDSYGISTVSVARKKEST